MGGKKWPKCHLLTCNFSRVGLALGRGVRVFHKNICHVFEPDRIWQVANTPSETKRANQIKPTNQTSQSHNSTQNKRIKPTNHTTQLKPTNRANQGPDQPLYRSDRDTRFPLDDRFPDLRDLARHVAAWEPCDLHDLYTQAIIFQGWICTKQIVHNNSLRRVRMYMI